MAAENQSLDTLSNDTSDELESLQSRSSKTEVMEIDTRNLAINRDKRGRTLMHKASVGGSVETVKILMELEPPLCLLRDNDCMTPLHLAIKNGHRGVTREIVAAFPESLEMLTDQRKTVFHFVLEKYHRNKLGVVEVLLEEVRNHGKEHLLLKQDRNGNNVAHIAVSKRLVEIVELLQSSTTDFTTLVNSLNYSGHTALDLHYSNKRRDLIARQIRNTLRKAGALEAAQLLEPSEESSQFSSPRKMRRGDTNTDERSDQERNLLLIVIGTLIATGFATVAGLPSFFPREKKVVVREPFHIWDAFSGDLPIIFYIILCLTVILLISMGCMVKLLYSLRFAIFLQLATVAIFIVYVLLASSIMPNYLVNVGPHVISSFSLMWILTSSIIFLAVVMKLMKEVLGYPKSTMAEDEVAGSSETRRQSVKGIHAVGLRTLSPSIRD